MSYLSILSSPFGKRGIWLYHFQRGDREWWWTSRSTSLVEPIADAFATSDFFSGEDYFNRVWVSAPLAHSRFKVTQSVKRAATEIVFNKTNEMAAFYFQDSNFRENKVTIYHQFMNDPDAERVVKFKGRIVSIKTLLSRFVLTAEGGFTQVRRKGLSAVIQRPCRHALYHAVGGVGCGVNIADFQTQTQCLSVSGRDVTVASAGGRADGAFNGGVFIFGGNQQMILKHVGTTLTLLAPIPNMKAAVDASGANGVAVSIAPGCDLSRATCNDRFDNLANFGGFPWADDTPYDGKTLF